MDSNNKVRITFYFLWLITLMVQSYCVELRGDEAYYWMYSKDLSWGYFDHPPVTAVLVKVGYLLFHNELGVRLFFIVCSTATIWIIEKMIKPSNLKLYYAIVLSVAFLQIGMVFGGGMFAIPDFPLLFFTALFFYLYRQYLQKASWQIVVLLSVVICLLLLSKYHGVLIIGFTLLSNLALLKRKSFWAIVGLSSVLFLPHLMWQFMHDFPSMKYHLFERSSRGYSFSYTMEYLTSQPFILGPFIGLLLIYLGVVIKPKNVFERSLKFMIIGTYLFFFLMTFKGRVEGNWTVFTLIPLLVLGYEHIERNERLRKAAFYSFGISILMIIFVRLSLMINFLPPSIDFTKSLGARRWASELKEKSDGKPAAFMNSYQRASLYEFYSGVPSFSLNNVWGRKNQYSIWDTEAKFQGEAIVLVTNYPNAQFDSVLFSTEYLPYVFIDNFRSASNVKIQSDLLSTVKVKSSDTLHINMKFSYHNDHVRDLESNANFPSQITYSFFQNASLIDMRSSDIVLKNNMMGSSEVYSIVITAPAAPGLYDFYLSVSTGWFPAGINSEKVRFMVE